MTMPAVVRQGVRRNELKRYLSTGVDFLECDINFDDLSRMTNPSGVTPAVGDRIASITDRISGLVLNEINSGGPTLVRDGALGGRAYAKFVASRSGGLRGVVANWLSHQRGHVWVVGRIHTTSPTQQCIWSSCDEATTTGANLYALWRGATNQLNIFQQAAADTADQLYTALPPDPAAVLGSGDITAGPGNFYVMHFFTDDGATTEFEVNRIGNPLVVTAGANNGDWTQDTPGRDNLCLGVLRRTSAANFFDGSIARFMAVTGSASTFDSAGLYRYLDAYYGRFVNVGVLGDSWSDADTSWTEKMRVLASSSRAANWNWVNCAVGGQTAAAIRSNSWTTLLQPKAQFLHAVVWMGTVNDMNDDVETDANALFASFRATADEILAAGLKLIVGEVGPWGGNTPNWTIARQAKHNEYTRLQRNYCNAKGCQFVPLYEMITQDPTLGYKQVYPTADATIGPNDRIAQTLELSGGLHGNDTMDYMIARRMLSAVSRALDIKP